MIVIDNMELAEKYDAVLFSLVLHQHLTPPSTPGLYKLELTISIMDKLGYTSQFKVLPVYNFLGFTTINSIFDKSHDIICGDWYGLGRTTFEPGLFRILAKIIDVNYVAVEGQPDDRVKYQGSVDFCVDALLPQQTAKAIIALRKLMHTSEYSIKERCREFIENLVIYDSGIKSAASTRRYEDLVSCLEAQTEAISAANNYVKSRQ